MLCGLLASRQPAVGQAAFALISPDAVTALRTRGEIPQAQQVIRAAKAGALREPHALARVHTEGTLPHQGIYDQSREAMRDWPAMRDLALGYALTGDETYLRSVTRYFAAWLDVYRASLNPIDETGLDNVVLAYDLVGKWLPDDFRQKMADLMRTLATGYLAVQPNTRKGTTVNNWQSHRVKLITLSAFALSDPGLIMSAQRALQIQLDYNLRADGSTVDFEQRDALHYVVYDLEPLLIAALAAKAHGLDWYGMKGRHGASLETGLQWLEPYATGEQTHEEFAHTTVEFDRTRAKAGLPGFSGRWDPKISAMLYQLAGRLNPRWTTLATQLGPTNPWLALCFPL
jgi:Alginate lyase